MHSRISKQFVTCFCCLSIILHASAQKHSVPALERILEVQTTDSGRINILSEIACQAIDAGKKDKAQRQADLAMSLAQKKRRPIDLSAALCAKGYVLFYSSNPEEGFQLLNRAYIEAQQAENERMMMLTSQKIALAWLTKKNGDSALAYNKLSLQHLNKGKLQDSLALRISICASIYDAYTMSGNEISAAPYVENMMNTARKSGSIIDEAWAAGALGIIYFRSGEYSTSIHYSTLELEIGRKNSNKEIEMDAITHIASDYNSLGDFSKAATYFNEAATFFKASGNLQALAWVNNNLAEVYFKSKDINKALKFYEENLKIGEQEKDNNVRAASLHNIGEIYHELRQDDKALNNYQKALAINLATHNYAFLIQNHLGIGKIFLSARKYDTALNHFQIADKIAIENEFVPDQAQTAAAIGSYWLSKATDSMAPPPMLSEKKEMLTKAIDHFTAASKISETLGALNELENNYSDLSAAYKAMGNYRMAMDYFQRSTALKDSLFSRENAFKIARLENDAEVAQKNEELSHTRVITSNLKRQRTYWYLGAGGLLALSVTAFFTYRLQQRRKATIIKSQFEKQVAEMEMQALRAQMNPHFIFNCLNSINRYIVKSDSITASGYLTKFSKLIRLILDHSASGMISVASEKQMLQLYMEMESLRFSKRFTYDVSIDETIDPDITLIPAMLIQPYVENAIWHGLMHKETGGYVSIHFLRIEGNTLQVLVEDNGIGREKAALLKSRSTLKQKSHGMRITGDRLRIVSEQQGTEAFLKVEDIKDEMGQTAGTRVILNIPYELETEAT